LTLTVLLESERVCRSVDKMYHIIASHENVLVVMSSIEMRHIKCSVAVGCDSVKTVRLRPDLLCPQITYDGREVPYQAIPAFISYNTTGRYIHELLDKVPSVTRSLQLVLNDERQLEREILVASLGRDSPIALENYRHNIEVLRWSVMPAIAELERRTKAVATELLLFEKLRGSNTASVDA